MTGIELITQERKEQIEKHGRTVEQDCLHNTEDQLAIAAMFLLSVDKEVLETLSNIPPKGWDENIWKYMMNKPYEKRLVIAGALIAAELDRLQMEKEITRNTEL